MPLFNNSLILFKNKPYILLAGTVALVVFAFAVWLPNIRLLFSLVIDPTVPISVKLTFPIRLLGSITTNFTALSASYTIAIALLTGINVALIAYYIRQKKQRLSQAGLPAGKAGMTVGTLGIVSGILGIGCAACGSLILASILGTAAGAGILALLPLRGGEFGIIGVILLGIATYLLVRQIKKPVICEIPN